MDKSLDAAAQVSTNLELRRRLLVCAEQAQMGAAIDRAADVAKLPPFFISVISTGRTAEHLAQSLDFLSQCYRDRFSRFVALLQGALWPALTIILGLMVGALVYALFAPLVAMIEWSSRTAL